MRWPWISKAECAARVAEARELWKPRVAELLRRATEAEQQRDRLAALLEQSQNYVAQHWLQNQALTKVIVELKKVGFEQPVNPADITTDAPLPDAVEAAIDQRAADGTELHRALQKYARQRLRATNDEGEGLSPDVVAEEIITGAGAEIFELL